MNLIEKAKASTPNFFKIMIIIGLAFIAIIGSLIASPIVFTAAVITLAGYVAVAGGVLSAISQLKVDDAAMKQACGKERKVVNKPRDGG